MLHRVKSYFATGIAVAESIPVTAQHIIVSVLLVGLFRSLFELFGSNTTLPVTWYVSITLHQIAFYACAYFLFLLVLTVTIPKARVQERQLKSVMLFGIFLGLLPPVIDFILPGSFFGYVYFSQFTWTLTSIEQPIGESITLWIAIFGIGVYVWCKTHSFIHSLFATISAYTVVQFLLFIIGVLSIGLFAILAPALGLSLESPEAVSLAYADQRLLALQGSAVLVLLGCLVVIFAIYRYKVFHMAFVRFPHALVWGALVLLGAGLSGNGIDVYILLKALILVVFFVLAQVENDYHDKALDTLTSRDSPVTLDDIYIIRFITAITVALFLIVDPAFGLLLSLFILLFNFAYSHTSFYLKRHFVSGSVIEGAVAFITLLTGVFYFSTVQAGVTIWYAALVAILFGVFANIRDFKDFEGDRQGGITTLYTFLAERGVPPKRTHVFLWLPVVSASVASMVCMVFGMTTTPAMYGVVAALAITAALPLCYIKRPRLSTSLAVIHTVLIMLVASWYIFPVIL